MDLGRLRLGAILFVAAGMILLLVGVLGEKTASYVLGLSFIVLGGGFAALARRE